ncbi:MAG: host attachment protein, partial [Francisellaceae bacterium]
MNINTWLVICNASQANVYEVSKVNYKLIDLLMHPQSRLKPQELISDRSGNFQSSQAMPGQFSPANNPQE